MLLLNVLVFIEALGLDGDGDVDILCGVDGESGIVGAGGAY